MFLVELIRKTKQERGRRQLKEFMIII